MLWAIVIVGYVWAELTNDLTPMVIAAIYITTIALLVDGINECICYEKNISRTA